MMDYAGVYEAEFHLRAVMPETWGDYGEPLPVNNASISANATDSVPLLQTADIDTDYIPGPGWYRLYMTARQFSNEREPLGTFLYRGASINHDYGLHAATAKMESVLKPADTSVTLGDYAPEGSDGAQQAARLLAQCTPAPIRVEGSFTLAHHVVFQPGDSCLKAVWDILDAGGFCIQLDGMGVIHIGPLPDEPALELSRGDMDMLMPGITEDTTEEVPNRYYAVQNGATAMAENRDGDNRLSYKTRGYWEDVYDTAVVRVNGETLQHYAERKLKEASVLDRKVSYKREFAPGVVPFSLIRCSVPEDGLDGDARVVSQSMDCSYGIEVSETISFTEVLWQG